MASTFRLKIVTPSGVAVDTDIVYLDITTPDGNIGLLAHHEPMLVKLSDGKIEYRINEGEELHPFEVKDAYFSFLGNTAEVISALI